MIKQTKSLAFLLAVVLVLSLCGGVAAEDRPVTLVILHTNDIHSRVDVTTAQWGYAKIATVASEERSKNEHVLLLDAGDALHGQSIANLSMGESIVEAMNLAGYDAMVAGNHDFNFGQERLLELATLADFPILGANVVRANDAPLLREYIIKQIGSKKVLLFGISTPETTYKTHPKNVEGLNFADPIAIAQRIVAVWGDKVDLVIALSHLGLEGDYTSTMLAEQVPGIDLIIDGHSHDKGSVIVGDTVIAQTGEYSANIGKVEITFGANGHEIFTSLIPATDATNVTADSAVLDLLSRYKAEVDAIQAVVIGSTEVLLEGTRDLVRTRETNLGNLITDAILDVSGAQVVLTNGGGIRASIPAGKITRKQVFDVLPFGNLIVVKEVPGSVIKEMLETGSRLYPASNGAFLHTAGLTYCIDDSKPSMERVHSVMVNGKPLMLDQKYQLATNDFMAAGGDGYTVLANYPIYAEMISLEEALAEYLNKVGDSVAPQAEGRIKVAPMPEGVTEIVAPEAPVQKTYIVQSGDVLWKIAQKFNTTWQILQQLNTIKNPSLIYPGQSIIVP